MGMKENNRKIGKPIPKGPRMAEGTIRKVTKKQTLRGMRKKKR